MEEVLVFFVRIYFAALADTFHLAGDVCKTLSRIAR